jgi:hypothetical protein
MVRAQQNHGVPFLDTAHDTRRRSLTRAAATSPLHPAAAELGTDAQVTRLHQ